MSKQNKSKHKIPIFLSKLLLMLEDDQIGQFICWISTKDGFKIPNVSYFTQNALPKYFKHRNYSSFVRQLNMYGFTKLRYQNQASVYRHPNFKKGNPQMLKNIQRKMTMLTPGIEQQKLQIVPFQDDSIQKQIQMIRTKQTFWQKTFMELLERNQMLIEQNHKLIYKMQKQKQNKNNLVTFILTNLKQKKQFLQLQSQNKEYDYEDQQSEQEQDQEQEQDMIQDLGQEEIYSQKYTTKKLNLSHDFSINGENNLNFFQLNDFASMDNEIMLDSQEQNNIQ